MDNFNYLLIKEVIPVKTHISNMITRKYINHLISAIKRINAEIRKADIAMAREIKRISR